MGLVGLGIHGSRYGAHLSRGEPPGTELAAVWTRDPEKRSRAAERWQVTASPSPEALVEAVDAVIVAVPVGLHLGLVEQIFARGRALLLEKPMAMSSGEARRMITLAGSNPFTIAQTLRFDPLLLELQKAARRPEFGRLVGFAFEQRLEPRDVEWEDDPARSGGGVLMQTGIHGLDALRFVTGAERVEVDGYRGRRIAYENGEDDARVDLVLGGGAAASGEARGWIVTSKLGCSRHHRFQLFFERGGLEADFIDRRLYSTVGRDRAALEVPAAPTLVHTLDAFARFLRKEIPNPVPPEEGLEAVRLVEAAYARST